MTSKPRHVCSAKPFIEERGEEKEKRSKDDIRKVNRKKSRQENNNKTTVFDRAQ